MDKEKKEKLEELKRRAQINKLKYELENNELFQECLVDISVRVPETRLGTPRCMVKG